MDLLLAAALGDYDVNSKSPESIILSPSKSKKRTSVGVFRETPKKRLKKVYGSNTNVALSPKSAIEEERPDPEAIQTEQMRLESEYENYPQTKAIAEYLSSQSRLWPSHEWFYSTIDRDYFNENEFKGCLQILGIDHVKQLTRSEWSFIRGIMECNIGRPRRFSRSFLTGERQKLNDYRRKCRLIQKGVEVVPQARDFPHQVFSPATVGDIVTVLNHKTGLLQRGQILTVNAFNTEDTAYRVQFTNAQFDSQIIGDKDIAVHGTPEIILCRRRPGDSEDLNQMDNEDDLDDVAVEDPSSKNIFPYFTTNQHQIQLPPRRSSTSTTTIDDSTSDESLLQAVAVYSHLLNRKELFLNAVRMLNQNCESSCASLKPAIEVMEHGDLHSKCKYTYPFTQEFISQHVWLMANINATDIAINKCADIVRERLIENTLSNQQQVPRSALQPLSVAALSVLETQAAKVAVEVTKKKMQMMAIWPFYVQKAKELIANLEASSSMTTVTVNTETSSNAIDTSSVSVSATSSSFPSTSLSLQSLPLPCIKSSSVSFISKGLAEDSISNCIGILLFLHDLNDDNGDPTCTSNSSTSTSAGVHELSLIRILTSLLDEILPAGMHEAENTPLLATLSASLNIVQQGRIMAFKTTFVEIRHRYFSVPPRYKALPIDESFILIQTLRKKFQKCEKYGALK
eukprot:gene5304-10611_t